MARGYLVAGNWKMNGSSASNAALLEGLVRGVAECPAIDVLVCPPAVYLEAAHLHLAASPIALGAQNLSDQSKPGAFTGEIDAAMLNDVGCSYVLVGHSERRTLYGEDDGCVARKFVVAQAAGLIPVLCIGETLDEREASKTESVLQRQLEAVIEAAGVEAFRNAVIAYEPVWAIGTGRTASTEQAQAAHAFIRGVIAGKNVKVASSVRILYGGSVKADNAASLFSCEDVDGGLIGGASLKAPDFLAICAAAQILAASRDA
jgi:triosephosphate isomerase